MPETKELTAQDAAREFLRGFDWDGETTERIDTIHDDLTQAITEAVQEEREECARIVEQYYKPLLRPGHPGHPCVLQIRARSKEKK